MVRLLFRSAFLTLALAAGLLLCAHAAGRVFTDRFHAVQFLWWLPALALVIPATALWALFALGRLLSPAARTGVPERWAGRILPVALLAAWGHFVFLEFRLHRTRSAPPPITSADRTTGADPATPLPLRVMQWNATSPDVVPRPGLLQPLLARFDPDVAFACVAMAPHQLESVVSGLPPGLHARRAGLVLVVSRLPILDLRAFSLGLADPVSGAFIPPRPGALPPAPDQLRANWETLYNSYGPLVGLRRRQFRNADPGWLTVARLQPPTPGAPPLEIWHIDLPSDPLRSKWSLGGAVAARLAQLTRTPSPDSPGTPALIIGDFNIPRGSASLGRAFPGLTSAFDQAGRGLGPTWPRLRPVLQLDQVFLPRGARCLAWGQADPGEGDHRAIIADVLLGH